ncbi:MAG TPA: hypothetical protein VN770_01570 [Gaiellaceae bacterium]|nr:hypothetical protein [Gaiellaceae bacterium]
MIARVLALGFAATVAGSSPRVAFEHLAPAISKEIGEHVTVRVERVAGARVAFEVVFHEGGAERFVGYADRGRVSWLTACFVREYYGSLCGPSPSGVAREPLPEAVLPPRFAHPNVSGLIEPGPLAVARDGSLLILDTRRDELFRRLPDGALQLVMPTTADAIAVARDGSIYLADGRRVQVRARSGALRTLPQRFADVGALAFFDGHLYVETGNDIVELKNGKAMTVVRPKHFFSPDLFAIGGDGDYYVYSGGTKTIEELTRAGKKLHEWQAYAHGLATAPDGSVVVGTQGGQLLRIDSGKLSTIVDLGEGRQFGFPFQEDGVAVGVNGTIYVDTDVGNGYTNQTALAAVEPNGSARLLRTTTPLAATLPPGPAATSCPAPSGLQPFDAAERSAAVAAAKVVDIAPFDRGLQLTDRSWWSGFYTDQIDGQYGVGRHHVYTVGPAAADPYSGAVARRCGAALVHDSLAIVVGPGVYSDQVSHMYFLDRDGRALLYWQHD